MINATPIPISTVSTESISVFTQPSHTKCVARNHKMIPISSHPQPVNRKRGSCGYSLCKILHKPFVMLVEIYVVCVCRFLLIEWAFLALLHPLINSTLLERGETEHLQDYNDECKSSGSSLLNGGRIYAPSSALLKMSYKRPAMGVGDSTCWAVFLKRPTSFSGILLWLKDGLFSAILLP